MKRRLFLQRVKLISLDKNAIPKFEIVNSVPCSQYEHLLNENSIIEMKKLYRQ